MGGQQPMKHIEYAIPCHDLEEESKTCTPVFRKRLCEDELIDNFDPPYNSIYELFKDTCKHYGDNPCMGDIIKSEDAPPRYKWRTYNEIDDLVIRTAKLI